MQMVEYLIIPVIKILVVFSVTMFIAAYTTYLERKTLGNMQLR